MKLRAVVLVTLVVLSTLAAGGAAIPTVAAASNTDAVTASDDSYAMSAGEVLDVDAPGVLENDTHADGDELTVNRTVSSPSNGELVLHANGSFEYTPDEGFNGEDSFTYEATDGNATDTANVTIDVSRPSITSCQVINEHGRYTVLNGIENSSDDTCIDVTASDVVIDGQGHAIDGVDESTGVGIEITGSGVTNVTVRNLTVTGFNSGVSVENANNVTLRNVTATGNGNDGVHLDGTDDATIVDGEMRDNGERGVFAIDASTSLAVRNTTISSNDEDGVGAPGLVVTLSSAQVTIENSTFDSNPSGGIGVLETTGVEIRNNTVSNSGGPGVWLDSGSADAVVADNTLTSNQKGIQVGRSTVSGFNSAHGVTLSGNDVSDSEDEGIHVLGSENVIVSNNDVMNAGTGSWAQPPFGIKATASHGIMVANNTVENSVGGVYLLDSDDGTARDNVVTGGEFGLIAENATGATLANNTVTGNAFDGINVIRGSDAAVRNNTATGNEWGLFLVQTENVTAVGNDVSSNANGTTLDATTGVTLVDTEATGNTDSALYVKNGSTVTSATNYTLASGTSVNFSAHDASLHTSASTPTPPTHKAQFGPSLEATNTAADGWLNLTVGYDDSTLAEGQNESTMRLWRHDGSWSEDVGGTNAVDEADDTVTANVTSFSTFALLADEEPVMNLSTDAYDFGEVNVDAANAAASVTVTNDGAAPLNVTGTGVVGENASEFVTPPIIGNITIQPGGSTDIGFEFGPSTRGTKNATLAIAHDAPGGFSNVSLTGTGIAPDVNVTTTTPVEFGDVGIGEMSDTMTVTIENNGTAPLNLIDAEIRGPDSLSFYFPSGGPTPYLLQPGESRTAEVGFQPLSAGDKTGYLDVAHNVSDRGDINVTLTGTGVDTTPPTLSDVTIADDDGDGYVNATDTLAIRADASDDETSVASVEVNASSLGAGNFGFDGSELPIDISPAVDPTGADGEGPHTVTVTATDEAGNSVSENATITLDTTGPTTTITQPADGAVLNTSGFLLNATADDATAGVSKVEFDWGDGWTDGHPIGDHWEYPTPVNPTPVVLSDGSHTVAARATDEAGNVGPVETVTVTVDTAAPVIETAALGREQGLSPSATVDVSVNASDATTAIESVTADGEPLTQDGTWWNGTVRASQWLGTHSASVMVTDEAGNAVRRTLNYTVGTEYPLQQRDSSTVLAETADGGVREVAITVDGDPAAASDETVLVRTPESTPVADAPGGERAVSLQFFQVNTTIESANVEEGVLNVSVPRDSIDGRYIVPERLSFWVYDADDGWVTESATGKHTGKNGTHRFYEVTVLHFSTYAVTGEVESTAPTVTVRSPSDGTTVNAATATIRAEYRDDYAGVDTGNITLQVDGNAVTDAATISRTGITYDATGLAEGRHDVTLVVPDAAGNANTEEWSFTVDTQQEGDDDTGGISWPPTDDQDQSDDGSDNTREIFIDSATIRDAVAVPEGVTPIYAERVRLTDEQSERVTVTFTENTTVSSVRFPPGTSGTITVTEFDDPTGFDGTAPGQPLTAFQLTGTEAVGETTATVRIRVPRDRIDAEDISLENLRVAHRVDGDWTLPETSVLNEDADAVLLETTVDSFSPFVVTAVGEPNAELTVTPSTAEPGAELALDASEASTPYGEITSYRWTVGDKELTGETATVALDEPGEYTVRLAVTNDAGKTATATTAVTVDAAVTPTATPPPTDGTAPTATPTATSTPESTATGESLTPTETADDGGPGFGGIVAVVGLLVAASVLARRAR